MRSRELKFLTRGLTSVGGSLLAVVAGLVALNYSSARLLTRLSYDLPFVWRAPLDTREMVLVYLDDDSAKKLNQPLGGAPWNRALHTQFLDRLTQEGARLVFYDIAFDAATEDAAGDAALTEAVARNGRVVLGAVVEKLQTVDGVSQERILPPIRSLRKAAAAWGLLLFRPVDPDYGVRQMFLGTEDLPTATWRAAELLDPKLSSEARRTAVPRWINYYGPPGQFVSISLVQALQPEGLPAGYFKDRIVFVGGKAAVGFLGARRDEFATPYTRENGQTSAGAEIHANILLNLLRREWLTRLPAPYETGLVLVIGLLVGALAWLRPLPATIVAITSAFVLTGITWWAFSSHLVWCAWLVPVGIQLPLGLFWSLGAQYYLEARRRKELRRAFGFYLSPEMADKIADSDFDLTPGGKTVEATVMFTDLEGFTTFSEDLEPAVVSRTLIAYFERTTRCILENKGMIVKYVGDSVMAAWGAPIDQPAHARFAAEAACALRGLSDMEVQGNKLRTRIGVHSGQVLAGNLGSSFRFDYTMIGDTTNFASRLEALNKYLRTQVLISEATRKQMGDGFIVRPLGEFKVTGKARGVFIEELICRCDAEAGEGKWIALFAEGLRLYRAGDFRGAQELLRQTAAARGGFDGPSEFYLKAIAGLEKNGRPDDWTGIIEMTEK